MFVWKDYLDSLLGGSILKLIFHWNTHWLIRFKLWIAYNGKKCSLQKNIWDLMAPSQSFEEHLHQFYHSRISND